MKSQNENTYRCSTCKKDLPGRDFGRGSASKSRPVSYRCKSCETARQKKRYHENADKCRKIARESHWKNRDQKLQRMKDYGKSLKDKVFNHYGGYVCACCGETEEVFLTLDHIDGGGNQHRRKLATGGYGIYRWIIKNDYPDGFQILCFNCNSGRALNGGVCPHEKEKQ